jgi:hypothetical protein
MKIVMGLLYLILGFRSLRNAWKCQSQLKALIADISGINRNDVMLTTLKLKAGMIR